MPCIESLMICSCTKRLTDDRYSYTNPKWGRWPPDNTGPWINLNFSISIHIRLFDIKSRYTANKNKLRKLTKIKNQNIYKEILKKSKSGDQ